MPTSRNLSLGQQGVTLIEVLVAILIFSIGILALMGLQTAAITNSSAAKYRTDASFLANQLFGHLWSNRQTVESSPDQFKHRPADGSGATLCAPTGAAATHATVTDWLSDVQNTLPGATSAMQQVKIEGNQMVTVTICWKIPGQTGMRNHTEVAQLVGSPIN